MSLDNDKGTIFVDAGLTKVSCDGITENINEGGHPKVYYSFDGRDKIHCHYCGRAFVKKKCTAKA